MGGPLAGNRSYRAAPAIGKGRPRAGRSGGVVSPTGAPRPSRTPVLLTIIHVTLEAERGRGKSPLGAPRPRGRAVPNASSAASSATPRRETGEAFRPPWPDACLHGCHPRPVNGYLLAMALAGELTLTPGALSEI